jgi:hypothetical protein
MDLSTTLASMVIGGRANLGSATYSQVMELRAETTEVRRLGFLLDASGIEFDSAQSDNGIDDFYTEALEG